MKAKNRLLFSSLITVAFAASSLSVQAAGPYYWDSNGATAGFGAAAGTWAAPTTGNSNQGWSTDSTGATLPTNQTTATTDAVNFGNGATGLATGSIRLANSATVASGDMTFASGSGAITISGGTAINLAAATTITVNNAFDSIGTALTGAGTSLTKAGTGTLKLFGANTYAGATILGAGTLQVGAASVGSVGAITSSAVGRGALNLNGGTISSDSTTARTLLNAVTFGGDVTLGDAVKNGALTFSANADLGGSTRMLTVASAAQFDGVLSNGGLTKAGAGTLTLTNANTYASPTTVNAGTLVLGFGAVSSNILSTSSALTLGGGTLQLTGTGTQTVAGLTTTANTASRILLAANETLTLGALTSAGANSSLNFNTAAGGANGASVGTSIVGLTGQTAGTAINSGFTVSDAGGFGLATVNGSDQVVRQTTGLNLLPASGATSATDYRVDNNAGGAAAAGSSTLAVTASSSAKSVTVDTTTANGTLTLNSGVVLSNNIWNFGGAGTNTYQITGAAGGAGLQSVGSGDTITFNNYNTGVVTIASPILANGASGVNINGTGSLKLSGANTYTGTTNLGSGTLQVGVGNVGSVGSITSSAVGTGTLALNGGTISSDSTTARTLLNAVTFGGDVTLGNATNNGKLTFSANANLGGAARALTVASAAQFDGIISNGGLTKLGTGTLTLTGANSFSGGTIINAGTLATSGSGTLGSSTNAVTITAGATLTMGGNQTVGAFTTNGGTLNGSGTLTVAGTATFNNNSNGGTTVINANQIVLGSYAGNTTAGVSNVSIGSGGLWVDSTLGAINGSVTNATLTADQTWGGMGFAGNARLDMSGTLTTNGYNLLINPFSIFIISSSMTFDSNVTFGNIGGNNLTSIGGVGTTITFNGTNNAFSGFNVDRGTVNVASFGNTTGTSSIGTATPNIAGNATLNYTGNTTSSNKGLAAGNGYNNGGTSGNSTFNVTTAGQTLTLNGNLTTKGVAAAANGWIFGGAGNLTLAGAISNPTVGTTTSVTKTGAGTLTLSNASNAYTGATTVKEGKLTIASTGNINSTSGVTIGTASTAATSEFNYNSSTALTQAVTFAAGSTGGTLSGTGTINPAVSITTGNTLAIGNSVGQMNFGDTLALAGTTIMEIDGTSGAGVTGGHDFANVTGAITYGGALTLDLGSIFATAGSYTWDLFNFAGADLGAFATITLTDQYSGSLLDADLNGVWDLTAGDNTWQFTESTGELNLTVVPEPNVASLLGGLGLITLLRRRRTA